MPHPDSVAPVAACRSWRAVLMVAVALMLPAVAMAQQPLGKTTVFADTAVYTVVEKMPMLPDGGGQAAIVSLIHKRFRFPLFCGQEPAKSRMIFRFTVNQTGTVCDIRILQSIDARVDSAIVRAVRSLPQFIPGCQHGRPVSVKHTMPIFFHWQ